MVKMKGNVTEGVLRGEDLIEKYYFRIVGVLGFEPFKGTLNVKLETPVDMKLYSTKHMEHVLLDGTHKTEAYLAPVMVSSKGQNIDCWAIRQPDFHERDLIEIIARENLRERLSLHNGDEVEVTFYEQQKPRKNVPGLGLLRKLYGTQPQLMKS